MLAFFRFRGSPSDGTLPMGNGNFKDPFRKTDRLRGNRLFLGSHFGWQESMRKRLAAAEHTFFASYGIIMLVNGIFVCSPTFELLNLGSQMVADASD